MTAPDRETPSTSWAVWAWQAYRDGRLVEASETHTPLANAHPRASEARMALGRDDVAGWIGSLPKAPLAEALAVAEVAALVDAAKTLTDAMAAFWVADEAADYAERYACTEDQVWLSDLQIAELRTKATALWQSIPAQTETARAALRAIGERANG